MYYVLFSCDIWKSSDSMSLITVTKSIRKLKAIIKQEILEGNICYTRCHSEDEATRKQMLKDWEDDLKSGECDFDTYLNHLDYAYIQVVEDGEVL